MSYFLWANIKTYQYICLLYYFTEHFGEIKIQSMTTVLQWWGHRYIKDQDQAASHINGAWDPDPLMPCMLLTGQQDALFPEGVYAPDTLTHKSGFIARWWQTTSGLISYRASYLCFKATRVAATSRQSSPGNVCNGHRSSATISSVSSHKHDCSNDYSNICIQM